MSSEIGDVYKVLRAVTTVHMARVFQTLSKVGTVPPAKLPTVPGFDIVSALGSARPKSEHFLAAAPATRRPTPSTRTEQ